MINIGRKIKKKEGKICWYHRKAVFLCPIIPKRVQLSVYQVIGGHPTELTYIHYI